MFCTYGTDRLYFHSNPLVRFVERRRVQKVLAFLDLRADETLLDVGCGEGYLLSRVVSQARAIGADLSAAAVAQARKRLFPAIALVQADGACLPFANHCFDKVCCSEVIEHVLDPQKVIAELHRIVKPAGTIVITVPHEKIINRIKDRILRRRWGRWLFPRIPLRTEWHLTDYSPELIHEQLKGAFKIEEIVEIPSPGLGFHYAVKCRPV